MKQNRQEEPLSPGRMIASTPSFPTFIPTRKNSKAHKSPETHNEAPKQILFSEDEIKQLKSYFIFKVPVTLQAITENNFLSIAEINLLNRQVSKKHTKFAERFPKEKEILEEKTLIPILDLKKNTPAYDSTDYDDIFNTLKKLVYSGLNHNVQEDIFCILVARDIYTLMQRLKAQTTEEANNIENEVQTKNEILNLCHIIYTNFIAEKCPFSLNLPNKQNQELHVEWQPIVNFDPKIEKQEIQIPPLELLFKALNALVSETRIINTVITPFTNKKDLLEKNEQFKEKINHFFESLEEVGCPLHCPGLIENLKTELGISTSSKETINKP
ncbi:MAG: hypothetical protein LEGION0398_MBIBDBAK_00957 [Legionellaceae bacterium]